MAERLRLEQAQPYPSPRAEPDARFPEGTTQPGTRAVPPGKSPGLGRAPLPTLPGNRLRDSERPDFLERLMSRLERQRQRPRTAHHHLDFYIRVAESKQRCRVELKKTLAVYSWLALKPAVFFRPLHNQPWDEPRWSLRLDVKLKRLVKVRLLPLTENFWEASIDIPVSRWQTDVQVRYRQDTMSFRKPEQAWRLTIRRAPFRLRLFFGTDHPSSIDYTYRYVGHEMSATTFRGAWRFDVNPQYMAQYSAELKRRF
jgi:hypothetical protein